jgi:hypothetical protein
VRKATIRSINHSSRHPSKYAPLLLLAAAISLCPAAAVSGTLDATDTATGTGALASENGGFDNTADGYYALYANTTGKYNTASGYEALYLNTTGSSNTASGEVALRDNTTGNGNTASGNEALQYNTTGNANTASGANALSSNTTGGSNTASGYDALYSNTTGGSNTASGIYALYSNTTGKANAANGFAALYYNTTGSGNVAVGNNALFNLTSGSNNLAIGINAGNLTTVGDSNIYIGHPGLKGSESKVIRVGQSQTKTFIAGIKGVPLSGATVVVNAAGQLGVVASSARYKKDIKPLADAADKLARLRPVSFRYKTEPQAEHYGLIAEEVDKVMPELVVRDDQGRPESVQYQEIIPLLLQDRQELKAELARQRALIERQAATLAALRQTLATRLAINADN